MATFNRPARRDLHHVGGDTLCLLIAVLRYVHRTFSVTRALTIAITFLSLYLLFEATSRVSSSLQWGASIAGLATFYLLFLQLRLVDDIADVDVDYPSDSPSTGHRHIRARLWLGLVVVTSVIVVVNRDHVALASAMLALGFMLATYLGLKGRAAGSTGRPIRSAAHRLGLAIVYEIAPFLIFAYVYCSWSAQTEAALPIPVALAFTAVFWTGYEFWKYSRGLPKLLTDPAGADAGRARSVLAALIGVSFLSQVAAWALAGLPVAYLAYAAMLCAVFGAVLWGTRHGLAYRGAGVRLMRYLGLLFVIGLNLGLLATVLVA